MAPSRKSRSVNKRFSYINDVAPKKDEENTSKNKLKKRKLSDMLGSQWTKEELQRFYEAYRKYGKDWKKVASVMRNRSVEMVEALYTMNRAYLSLPEGTASVAGLIAMMTDHYSVMARTDSEGESDDVGASQKLQKRGQGKFRHGMSKGLNHHFPDFSHSQSGSRPRAVGKRTPRIPISYSYDKDNVEKYFSPSRQFFKFKAVANDDDDVAHEIALALAEASQRGGSPQVSITPKRKKENDMSLHAQNVEKKSTDDGGFEGSLGSMEADNVDYPRDGNYLIDTEGVGTVEVQKKGKKFYGKKPEIDIGDNNLDDIKEACSGTEQGQILGAVNEKREPEVADAKVVRSSSKGPRKRSKKVLFGADEGSAFDALQTLADLSLMMPRGNDTENERQEVNTSEAKEKGKHPIPRVKVTTLKASKLGKVSNLDCAGSKERFQSSISEMQKRKQKSLASKSLKIEGEVDSSPSESRKMATEEVKKSRSKGKRSFHTAAHQKQGRIEKPPEQSASSTDHRRERDNPISLAVEVQSPNQTKLPTKVRSRRKMNTQETVKHKERKTSENIVNEQPSPSFHDKALDLKEKLSNCLSWYRLRRWCTFEWFYSAIDYPWFAKMEFVEYLDHVRLGHIPRLTRVEWGVIRSSLGKPRRFSEQFLKEEKEKLNQYRDSVRTHYSELRAGIREGLPADLARPLSVGQRVIAIHPRKREIHDGSVLTVDHSRCRVQFDRPELGVEFVKDIDCMPFNPLENIPASLTMHNVAVHYLFKNLNALTMNRRIDDPKLEGCKRVVSSENLETPDGVHISPATNHASNLSKQEGSSSASLQAKVGPRETTNAVEVANAQPSLLPKIQAKEADVRALSELTRALDRKEAVVSELRRMNDEVLETQKYGGHYLKDSGPFRKQYAAVLLQLSEANERVSSALFSLRQRNAYQRNSPLMWMKPMASVGDPSGFSNSFDCSACDTTKTESHVVEIVETSRRQARTMLNAAMQAVSSLKEGRNGVERIEEAIDFVNNQLSLDESNVLIPRSTTKDGSLSSQDQLASCTSNPSVASHAPDMKLNNGSDQNDVQIPSELVAHCVATLLMIQKCTERQFPPADVAQILDSAVASLQPCCSQNLPIYAEIQKCMGMIRSQILALIPT